jgi:MFS family permease
MAVFGLSSIVGPTAGGWITDNWGWRWVFYVNMPVGAAAVAVAALALPSAGRRRQHQIDYWGALTLAAGAVPLLLAFSWAGTQYAWGSAQIIGLLIVAVLILTVFVVVETRVVEPVITPALFRNSIFTVSVVATFLLAAGMFGAILYLPLFVQGVLGNTATNSGVVLTPMMLGFIVSSTIGGQILSRTGRYKVLALAGFVVATAGMFLLSRMDVTTTDAVVVRNMAITGLGVGVLMSLFTIVVQNAFPFHQLGQVTASVQFFRSMGSTIGIAILGTVLTNQFQSGLQANLPATLKHTLPPGKLAVLQYPQVLLAPGVEAKIKQGLAAFGPQGQVLFHQLIHAIRVSLAGAITDLFVVTTGLMLLALVTTLFLREIPLRTSNAPSAPADGAAREEAAR